MAGEFCYYFTFGLDAEGAYRFDHLRKTKPHLTKKRKINMFWYMYFIVRTGESSRLKYDAYSTVDYEVYWICVCPLP